MEALHEGGCACGSVRYRVKNAPFRTSACHCRNCQRRTGSAFGVGIYFKSEDFELLSAVTWTAEFFPGGRTTGCRFRRVSSASRSHPNERGEHP